MLEPSGCPFYAEHCEWLRCMRSEYQARQVDMQGSPLSLPVGFAEGDGASLPALSPRALDFDLPESPMAWGGADGYAAINEEFGIQGLSLDDSAFDSPVYRSINSNIFAANAEFTEDPSLFNDDALHYRSLGGAVSPEPSFGIEEEPSRSKWLQTLPPLLCRQKGGLVPALHNH